MSNRLPPTSPHSIFFSIVKPTNGKIPEKSQSPESNPAKSSSPQSVTRVQQALYAPHLLHARANSRNQQLLQSCSATTAHFDLFHPDFLGDFWLNFHTTTAFPYPWGKI
uniref:Uncharacterized protein n=1 Tax=Solanum tuberosum TaxID=4113 RepID=M1BR58_SOLTU